MEHYWYSVLYTTVLQKRGHEWYTLCWVQTRGSADICAVNIVYY